MAVYRILVKKQLHSHSWSNAYVVVSPKPYTQNELIHVADAIAPRFVAFERHFHSEEVQIVETVTTAILSPPIGNTFARRPAATNGWNHHSLSGLRPIAVEGSLGAAFTLVLGLQPVANRWGVKYYRYALRRDEIQSTFSGYQLTMESRNRLEHMLTIAKQELLPLMGADPNVLSFALHAAEQEHNPMAYKYRYVRDITVKGVAVLKSHR